VAQTLRFNYTGADFYAMCTDAMMNAIKRKIRLIEERVATLREQTPNLTVQKYLLNQQDLEQQGKSFTDPSEGLAVEVNEEDFQAAIASLVPSVSDAELAHYRSVQKQFADTSAANGGAGGSSKK